jgi:hypothetical protein
MLLSESCQPGSRLTRTAHHHSFSTSPLDTSLAVPPNFVKSLKNMPMHVSQIGAVILVSNQPHYFQAVDCFQCYAHYIMCDA